MTNRGAAPILYVITVLLAANLALTVWLVASGEKGSKEETAAGRLPDAITGPMRKEIVKNFSAYYNASDTRSLYNMLDELAKIELSEQKIAEVFGQIRGQTGEIDDGVYSHHKNLGRSEGRDWYNLFYKIRFKGGQPGTFKASVFSKDGRVGIMGLHINIE